jgi:hypothetical protein
LPIAVCGSITASHGRAYYRCETVFDRVTAWLKQHGVSARKPVHALRKEYGSLINAKYDLVTAKELLRHSSVAITAAHYVENRKRGTTGLGAVLVKRMRKDKGKKTGELGSSNGNSIEHFQKLNPDFPTLQFRFAKTMPEHPHSYVRRSPENEDEYLRLFHRITKEGVLETFQGRRYRYWYAGDGFKYWSMGHVINRARAKA